MSALDQIRARLEAATEYHPTPHRAVVNTAGDRHGVLDASGSVVTMDPPPAAQFYANAPTDVTRLLAALTVALSPHQREVLAVHEGYGEEALCSLCQEHWPCGTVANTTAALEGKR